MSQFTNDLRTCNVIVGAMIRDGHVSAEGIAKLTDLPIDQCKALAESLNDDGVIDAAEIAKMTRLKKSDRLVKMAAFIGGSPHDLYDAATTLMDVRAKDRCGTYPPLGSENKDYEEKPECRVTLESYTPFEKSRASEALHEINRLKNNEIDIIPAIKLMLGRFASGVVESRDAIFALADERFDLSKLTFEEKTFLAEALVSGMRKIALSEFGATNDIDTLIAVMKILGKFGDQGKYAIISLEPVVRKFIANTDNRHLIPEMAATYSRFTGKAISTSEDGIFKRGMARVRQFFSGD